MNRIITCIFTLFVAAIFGQTFNGGGGPILDLQSLESPLIISIPQTQINTTSFGLETVCVTLTHTYLADLTIEIEAPDGTRKLLSQGIGGEDDDMTNTCFNQSAAETIGSGNAPFTGVFQPMSQMGSVNNGQNPNGTWKLIVRDDYGADEGILVNWSITFGAAPADYFQFTESDLPIVVINTNGGTIDNDIKITADMGIIYNGIGNRNYLSDPFNEYDGKIGIEYRGNYSLSLPQKPFSLELRDDFGNSIDSSLIDMPAENDWNLIANYNDKSFARNPLAFEFFEEMGNYSVRYRHVDVVLNNEYQGIYLLTEKIKRDSNRVDVSKLEPNEVIGQDVTGGYILKIDYWDNSNSWQSNYSPINNPGLDVHFVYYYPSPEDIVLQQKTYIQNFMNEFETALYASDFDNELTGYRKYISVPTFIDYLLANEVARNRDGFKKSRFLYKEKDHADGTYRKLKAGPVWDFDWAFKDIDPNSEDGSGFMHEINGEDVNTPGWYIRLLQDTLFANELKCRYVNLRNSSLSEAAIFAKIDSIALKVNESQAWHYLTWGHLGAATGTPEQQAPSQTYAEEMQKLKDWVTRRLDWLDQNMPGTLAGCGFAHINSPEIEDLDIYPNPFQNSIYVSFSNKNLSKGTINLLDAQGRVLVSVNQPIPMENEEIQLTGLSELSSGMYFIEVVLGDQKMIRKMIK
jgi:subtilisin-like proprotein convertase family protein